MKYIDCTTYIGQEIQDGLNPERIGRMLDLLELCLYFSNRIDSVC